jgi:GNAT superfamily N-acetyltransferase
VIEIAAESFESSDATELMDELRLELNERYGGDLEPGQKPSVDDVEVFVVARESGAALGCGALRSLGEPVVEIKRMYVRPQARGRGLGAAILAELEREAVQRGFRVVRLETGPMQPEAIHLYARAGYREIPCFGAYAAGVASKCFERRLA